MCRIVALPPSFKPQETMEILRNFCAAHTDGVGSVYVKNGKFVVNKWPCSLYSATQKRKALLKHMPHQGWTLVHLRAASHGNISKRNTHPFVVNDRAYIHNGVWTEYSVAKPLIEKSREVRGETDSEVAAHYFDILGLDQFTETVDRSGVWMALHRDGSLEVSKTSGDLCILPLSGGKILISSELDDKKYPNQKETVEGWARFDAKGRYIEHKIKKSWSALASVNPEHAEEDKPAKVESKIASFLEEPVKYKVQSYSSYGSPYNGGGYGFGHGHGMKHDWVPRGAGLIGESESAESRWRDMHGRD